MLKISIIFYYQICKTNFNIQDSSVYKFEQFHFQLMEMKMNKNQITDIIHKARLQRFHVPT